MAEVFAISEADSATCARGKLGDGWLISGARRPGWVMVALDNSLA